MCCFGFSPFFRGGPPGGGVFGCGCFFSFFKKKVGIFVAVSALGFILVSEEGGRT